MAENTQRKLIIVLVAVLLAVIVASGAVILLIPSGEQEPRTDTVADPAPQPDGFDLNVLDRSSYRNLNLDMIQPGFLPVQPPRDTGKANPFL